MKFDDFVIATGYIGIAFMVITVILTILMMSLGTSLAKKENFSYARRMLHEGIPGPVWFYYW
jgi:UPF0716 family protein affecting phage T7 exclusion